MSPSESSWRRQLLTTLHAPLENHTVSALKWWLLCRRIHAISSWKKPQLVDRHQNSTVSSLQSCLLGQDPVRLQDEKYRKERSGIDHSVPGFSIHPTLKLKEGMQTPNTSKHCIVFPFLPPRKKFGKWSTPITKGT